MRPYARWFLVMIAFTGIVASATLAPLHAQPGGKKGDKKGSGSSETAADFASRVLAFNKAKDGKLTKTELTDTRLHGLFDRADANKDGVVTREELEALHARESAGAGGDGKGDFGDKKGKGPKDKGPGDKGGFGDKKGKSFGPPQTGQVLPPFLLDALNLTEIQRKDLADLQKDVDSRLATILTSEQRALLRSMGEKKGPPPGDR
jgi:hypothetical protein